MLLPLQRRGIRLFCVFHTFWFTISGQGGSHDLQNHACHPFPGIVTPSRGDPHRSKGYLIKEDVPRIVQQAGARWDYVMGQR